MTDKDNSPANIVDCPTEVLWNIFSYLKAKQLLKCREVCWRWKDTIDEWTGERSVRKSECFWRRQCQVDFKGNYKSAHCKRIPGLSWRDLYRSLSLWPKLLDATETRDEFASASSVREEIRDFNVLRHGEIGVHTSNGIVYYDLQTLKRSIRSSISGNYFNYDEDDEVIIILGITSDLYIIRKFIETPLEKERTSFPCVKNFLLDDNSVYYVTFDNDLYVCDLRKDKIVCDFLERITDGVVCLGCKDGLLNVLTYKREVYTFGSNRSEKFKLDGASNLMQCMHQFGFLERLDWGVFFQWMLLLNRAMPTHLLRDVIIVKVYGDVVFLGTRFGVFQIYYAPYINNEFDLFYSEPLKQYNFMETSDCPVLSHSPIMQIDVVETKEGHTVLVGMPKKIVLLKFSHESKAKESGFKLDEQSVTEIQS